MKKLFKDIYSVKRSLGENIDFQWWKFVGKLIFQHISDIEKYHLSNQNVKLDMCYLHISYSMEISNLINLQ